MLPTLLSERHPLGKVIQWSDPSIQGINVTKAMNLGLIKFSALANRLNIFITGSKMENQIV